MHHWRSLSGPLAARAIGDGPRLVLLHGFTQTGNSWQPIAERVAWLGFECLTIDLPGHGSSATVRADLRRTADMVAAMAGDATYVGYSMGGRVALHCALMYPHLVRGLVSISAQPGIDDDDERRLRRNADSALAERVGDIGVAAFLDEWLAQPLFAGMTIEPTDLADRLTNTADGLASSLRMAGTGTQVSLWPRLNELTMPTVVCAGSLDTKFVDIGMQMVDRLPNATFVSIPYCGHSVVVQAPELIGDLIATFVTDRVIPQSPNPTR